MSDWKGKNRHKTLLQYHIIFVCKYRQKLLTKQISDSIKQLSYDVSNKHEVIIHEVETDKDHIHYMVEMPPSISVSDYVRMLKSYTTYHVWRLHRDYLKKRFWKENTFWSDGYFCASIGNVSQRQLKKYIQNQG